MKDLIPNIEEIDNIDNINDNSLIDDLLFEIEAEEKEGDSKFYANLADDLTESARNKLSSYLLDAINEDIESRRDWIESIEKIERYLGFSIEDLEKKVFREITKTFDTTLANALIRFYSSTRAELLPSDGPVGFKINGDNLEQLEIQGEKLQDWMNYYLTVVDKPYYADFERFLLYLGLYGCTFKKVWFDPILGRPLSRFILPRDFIADNDCANILESNRLTHILHLSKRDILQNQQTGVYREVELAYLKSAETTNEIEDNNEASKNTDPIKVGKSSKRSLFPIYEVHTYLNLEEFNDGANLDEVAKVLPLPYIVTIDKVSKEILAIRRNWAQEDKEQKRKNYFIQYNYLPGFNIYGLGLGHLIGSNAVTLTKLLRQLVDAGSFKNLPAGLRQKGFKQQQNDFLIGPGEFVEVDTGGILLRDAFMPLPYSEPSVVLKELRQEIVAQTRDLASTSEMSLAETPQNTPVGTTLAIMETSNRIQSAVLKSIHFSLTQELQLLYDVFKENMNEKTFFANNKRQTISAEDFIEEITVIPISDPSINSITQRIMRAESILKVAQTAPELHDMRAVYDNVYKAFGIQDIDSILKPNPDSEEVLPLDPITENIYMLKGMPVKAAIWQAHAAHKLLHGVFVQNNPDTQLQAAVIAHIKEHEAYEYLIESQQMLGADLPPLEELQNPEVQNAIAMGTAQSLGESRDINLESSSPSKPIDPNTVMMADIEQKAQEVAAKEEIANLKAETDVFKAQLEFEKEQMKIDAEKEFAQLKAEIELKKEEMKLEASKELEILKSQLQPTNSENTNGNL